MERTLREGRERANLLDLVAEEVDAERLATRRREDVDEAAPDGELPALVHAIDPLVARERELLGEPVDARLVADSQLERERSGLERRQAVGERPGGRADETAGRERVQRPVPLAHEVRGRREARLEAHAAARKQRDTVAAEEPPRRLRRIAGVGVLGEENEQSASQLLVERGKEERQYGLRDARPGRKRPNERLKAVVPPQLVDERGERRRVCGCGRLVHGFDGDRAPRGHRTGARRVPIAGRRSHTRARINHPQGHPRCPDVTLSRNA